MKFHLFGTQEQLWWWLSEELGGEEPASEWEMPAPKVVFLRPCNQRKQIVNWTKLVSQSHGISKFQKDKISNKWPEFYRDIPHRKLITALQLRDNVYPTRDFLARGRQETQIKSCRHCQAENETYSHIIGYCPPVQDMRIKRHNQLCVLLGDEAKKKEWVVVRELLLKDKQYAAI